MLPGNCAVSGILLFLRAGHSFGGKSLKCNHLESRYSLWNTLLEFQPLPGSLWFRWDGISEQVLP